MFTWRKNSFLRPRTHDIFSIVRGLKLYIFIYNTRGNDKSFLTIRDFVLMSNIIFIYLFIIYIIYLCLCKFTVILHHHWFPFATCTIVRAFLMNYVFFFFLIFRFLRQCYFKCSFFFTPFRKLRNRSRLNHSLHYDRYIKMTAFCCFVFPLFPRVAECIHLCNFIRLLRD